MQARRVIAIIVRVGLCHAEVGQQEPSTTSTLATPPELIEGIDNAGAFISTQWISTHLMDVITRGSSGPRKSNRLLE